VVVAKGESSDEIPIFSETDYLPSVQGYDFRDAVDGRDGVSVYESDGPFEYATCSLETE
jgi:hypothetical protein